MRIAYLTQPYPPMVSGAANVAEQLANDMAARGHEVLVIAASDTGRRYIVREKNLTVLRLVSFRNPLRVNQRLMLFPGWSVLKALREFQPNVIHAHEPIQMGSHGIKYAKSVGIPVLLTAHQLPWFVASYLPDLPGLRSRVEKLCWKYARWAAGRFTAIISPTKTISSVIKSKTGLKPRTINYGIDLQVFNPGSGGDNASETRARYKVPADAHLILHVGRLDVDKSVDRVILAVADIIRKTNARLLIVGDGCQKPKLIRLCKSLGMETRVHLTGFINCKRELAEIYRASDVFVTASEIETQGIVLLEAAACGLPIAAVNATCIPEVVRDGVNGCLARPGDIPALSKAIEKILGDPVSAKSMKGKSRLVAEKYDIESTFGKHERLYLRILKQTQESSVLINSRFHKKYANPIG